MTQGRTTTITAASGRRRITGALLAIGAGSALTSGIAAGVAASVTELSPSNPDAGLLALCARFVAADRRHEALCNRQEEIGNTNAAEWERLDNLVLAEAVIMLDAEPQIAATAATSPAGLRAKALAVRHVTRNYKDGFASDMLHSLLSDLMPAEGV